MAQYTGPSLQDEMSTVPLSVRPIGVLPPAIHSALEQAGVALDDHATLCVIWYPDPTARSWLRGQQQSSAVAFVDHPDRAREALEDGALDALVGTPGQLRERLSLVARVDEQWRGRFEAQLVEEHRTASELQSTRDLLSRIVDTTPCPVMAVGPTGNILVFNHAAESVLGYDRDQAHDQLSVADVYADAADASRILSVIRASPRRLVRDIRTRLRTRRGETLEVSLNAAEVYAADGLPVATVGVFLDHRDHRDLQRRLEATTRQLLDLEADNHSLTRALGEVHLLNQPLNTSMLTVEMLMLQPGLPDPTKARLDRIYRQMEKLAANVAELTAQHHRTFRGHRLLDPLGRSEISS